MITPVLKRSNKTGPRMCEMTVDSLTVDPVTHIPIIILKDKAGRRTLPLWIGVDEAAAIARELDPAIDAYDPSLHDVLARIIGELGASVDAVDVLSVEDNVFHSVLKVKTAAGSPLKVSAGAGAAIALGMRSGAKIRVAQKVIDQVSRIDLRAIGVLEQLTEEDFGKWKM